mmetsp:Transcript_11682/g.17699  ORF Transcript_11682/g.17699 Transcript_11682/m.17699 type:complete len:303 (+) Transcript_11682:74-982(+)
MASFAAVDKDVVNASNESGEQNEKVANIDVSTVAYIYDLATQPTEVDTGFRKCIIERHENFHIRGVRPHATFSIRFGTPQSDDENTSRLWAQRHMLAQNAFYVISASPYDLDKKRNERSEHFLGKLKRIHGSVLYEGVLYRNEERKPLVGIVYDHDRNNHNDRKMEVGIPTSSVSSVEEFSQNFKMIRHEGAQNSAQFPAVEYYNQITDDPELMKSPEILEKFQVDGEATALVVSAKNFQLVKSEPYRLQYRNTNSEDDTPKVVLQLGKLDSNLFTCYYTAPFTLLQAFMIALSRFETQQKY